MTAGARATITRVCTALHSWKFLHNFPDYSHNFEIIHTILRLALTKENKHCQERQSNKRDSAILNRISVIIFIKNLTSVVVVNICCCNTIDVEFNINCVSCNLIGSQECDFSTNHTAICAEIALL